VRNAQKQEKSIQGRELLAFLHRFSKSLKNGQLQGIERN
jgi:hypothetical protein